MNPSLPFSLAMRRGRAAVDYLDSRRARPAGGQPWYAIENRTTTDGTATVILYGDIGDEGNTAEDFVEELLVLKADRITVRISSMGGDAADGITIYNAIRAHPAHVTTRVEGWAASTASVVTQAGNERLMVRHSQMLIHEVTGFAIGTAGDVRDMAALVDRQTDLIAGIYAEHGTRAREHYLRLMRAGESNVGTLMTDTETVEQGLADRVVAADGTAAARTTPPTAEDVFGDLFPDGVAAKYARAFDPFDL